MKNRLKVLRAEREWSQADLAQRLEVSRQSVNAIETGKYDPSLYLPPEGGTTEWANTYAAYDALPESDKAALEGLRVVHANWRSSGS